MSRNREKAQPIMYRFERAALQEEGSRVGGRFGGMDLRFRRDCWIGVYRGPEGHEGRRAIYVEQGAPRPEFPATASFMD